MSDRSERARSIFLEAIDCHAPEEWLAFVEQACGSDAELRACVEKLLRARAELGSFHEEPRTPPIVPAIDEVPLRERPGTVIGAYKLLEQIGEGGFGVVFMAEQTKPLRRKVALKVLKPGMDMRQVVARFEAERQALALMDHPNIAHVLDGGETASGRPFFVMELVKGIAITTFCDQNQLSVRQRLELFVSVCSAVQHAHQKGIIHRDLKPSNVLVTLQDGKPLVKVIDFGIAKALAQQLTDKTVYTGLAQMIGTPLYMSPEQAALSNVDVDTRSDVYSLGVLLYELLTGTTPFTLERLRTVGQDEMRRIIREEEPPRPSTRISTLGQKATTVSTQRKGDPKRLSQVFRGELDWMVMKALEKDRNRRYESASAFAQDIQRYLHDEPVLACPPSVLYRLRKFGRRNKTVLLTAGSVALAVLLAVGGVAGNIGWAVRDREARRATTAEQVHLALKEASVLQEQQKWRDALAAVKRARAVLASGSGTAELHQRVQELGKDLEMAARLDNLRLQKSHGTDASFKGGDPRAAITYARLFESYGIAVLTDPPEEVAAGIAARSIPEQLVAALDDWILVQTDARVRQRLRAVAQRADANPWRNRMRKAVVENDRRALEELAARPEVADFPPATAHLLGQALANVGAGDKAVEVLTAVQRRYPGDFWLNYQLGIQYLWGPGVPNRPEVAAGYLRAALVARPAYATVYLYLGLALPGREHLDEVIALNRKAIELERTYFDAHLNLAWALSRKGKLTEAATEFREALRLRPEYAQAHSGLGGILAAQGKHAEAEKAFRTGLRLRPDDAAAHNDLSNALRAQGKLAEAETESREALRLKPQQPEIHLSLGCVLHEQGRHPEAMAAFREALRLRPGYADAHFNLGVSLQAQSKFPEAEMEYRQALSLRPDSDRFLVNLGTALAAQGKHAAAEKAYREALRLQPGHAEAHNNLGGALYKQGKHADAEREYREAARLRPDLPNVHFNLGTIFAAQGKPGEAEKAFREELRRWPENPKAHNGLGNALADQGKPAEAEKEFRAALRLQPDHANAHCNLGDVLRVQGRFTEALDALKRGHELGSRQPGWRHPSAGWVREVEQLIALDAKLARFLQGQFQPADALDRIALARLCQEYRKRYAVAARFYAEAFVAEPKLAASHRYNAACAAALAAAGQGVDAAKFDEKERARLRRQARRWLRADLTALGQLVEKGPEKTRAAVQRALRHWQQDTDFAGVRGDALAKLPEAERQAWQQLWADVEQKLKK
jgi:serine/threonine protein kinase/Flp pilus assembly protein TadD